MEPGNSEVSIDQVARLAGQACVYSHDNTREFDRAVLAAAADSSLQAARVSPAQRFFHTILVLLRG